MGVKGFAFLGKSAVLLTFAGGLLFPSIALAKPVYLTCDFMRDGKSQPRKFTLDEDRGTAAIFYIETAESETLRAQFGEDHVFFENYVDRFMINRRSLVAARQAKVDETIDRAQCRIESVPDRAF